MNGRERKKIPIKFYWVKFKDEKGERKFDDGEEIEVYRNRQSLIIQFPSVAFNLSHLSFFLYSRHIQYPMSSVHARERMLHNNHSFMLPWVARSSISQLFLYRISFPIRLSLVIFIFFCAQWVVMYLRSEHIFQHFSHLK